MQRLNSQVEELGEYAEQKLIATVVARSSVEPSLAHM
jgi:hypothetical protein